MNTRIRTAIMAAITGLLSLPAMALEFSIVDLGRDTSLADINNMGQVAGTGPNGTVEEAFIFNNNTKTFLGSLTPNAGSSAAAINDKGQVVGTSQIADVSSPPTPTALVSTPFIFDNDTMTSLQKTNVATAASLLPSTGTGINNDGTIIGNRVTSRNPERQNGFVTTVDGNVAGSLNPPATRFNNINNKGLIAGEENQFDGQTESEPFRAVVFDQNLNGTNLGTLGGQSSRAAKINNQDHVIGAADTAAGNSHAFLLTNLEQLNMRDLGTLGGQTSSANGINDFSVVVGDSALATGTNTHAFLFLGNEMLDLNSLIAPNSGWELLTAVDINNLGQIIGEGIFGGERHAFLLNAIGTFPMTDAGPGTGTGTGEQVPIPEPSTVILLGLGLITVAVITWKKRLAQ